jgi:hypothetical protein
MNLVFRWTHRLRDGFFTRLQWLGHTTQIPLAHRRSHYFLIESRSGEKFTLSNIMHSRHDTSYRYRRYTRTAGAVSASRER